MLGLSRILINYQENPVGIEKIEQVGWVIVSDQKHVIQKNYELQISRDEEFGELVYDSGVTESGESAHVVIDNESLKLQSSTKYFIRVRISAKDGGPSEWKTGFFVTALLSEEDWKAEFITIETEADKDDSRGSYVRNEIVIGKKVKAAYAHVTALGLYQLYINGKKVGDDEFTPGWTSYNKHLLYQTYDVTDYLYGETGEEGSVNAVAGHIGAGWYKGTVGFVRMRNHYGTRAAFACQIAVEYVDGSRETFLTDTSWKGIYSPVLFSEIYDGEIYDARREIPGWNEAGLNTENWADVAAVPFRADVLSAQSGCKVKQITEVPAKRIFQTPQGDTVIDFGQNMTGWIEFKVKGRSGDRVELNCFEVLDAEGNVYLDNLRSAKETIIYTCKDSEEVTFHPHFSFQGFQFAKVSAYPGELKEENFTAYALHSDMAVTGEFECSNPDINQLQHNIIWGMKGNFLDVPTDCPQRDERLGWTGDAQIFCRTATFLKDTYTFYSKWLRDVEADQTDEGGVPHVIPDILIGKSSADRLMKDGDHSAAAWADVAIIMPWTLYLTYGDTTVIERQYDSMKAWIGFMQEHSVGNIWNYKLQFGDWVALDAEEGSYFGATPNDLTCTAYYAYSTRLFVKMAEIIGRTEDAEEYRKLYNEIVDTYQKTFFDETGHMNVQTQTAQIVSLYFDLVPEAFRQNVVDDLLRLLDKENGHLVTGFVGTPYFCHALSQNGHTKEAYELLLKDDFPSWLYQVRMGATTIWEHWDGMKPDGTMWSPDMNSFNHYAYGAIGEWLYRAAAGIECDEKHPGYKHSIIAPHPGGGLVYVKASYESVYGKIVSDWNVDGNRVTLHVEVPCNTTASICPYNATEILDSCGLAFEETREGYRAEAGSGIYEITYLME
ncbi:alpha-L-rhamnosidase [Faecalicatena orotica]|uniref:alpha-L-rhamnosidase n=1 Tax=Faecalicatena orotica TaxID=1544 RepID=UPI003216F0A2